ncbi:MAG: YqgE/AlgH family protein [Lawsonella clevelandensis]
MVGGAVSDFQMNPYGNLSQFGAFADRIFLAMEQRDPYKGCLLVSAPDLRDEVFSRSIIYLFEHDDTRGTFGIILNQQSEVSVHSVLPSSPPTAPNPPAFSSVDQWKWSG